MDKCNNVAIYNFLIILFTKNDLIDYVLFYLLLLLI